MDIQAIIERNAKLERFVASIAGITTVRDDFEEHYEEDVEGEYDEWFSELSAETLYEHTLTFMA